MRTYFIQRIFPATTSTTVYQMSSVLPKPDHAPGTQTKRATLYTLKRTMRAVLTEDEVVLKLPYEASLRGKHPAIVTFTNTKHPEFDKLPISDFEKMHATQPKRSFCQSHEG